MDNTSVVEISGLNFQRVTELEVIETVITAATCGIGGWLETPNLDMLHKIERDARLRDLLRQADVRVADGMPVIWASKLLGDPLPERVTGAQLVEPLVIAAQEHDIDVVLIGGDSQDIADAAVAQLKRVAPGARVQAHSPPMGFDPHVGEIDAMLGLLGGQTKFVLVGLGFPKQEVLIERLRATAPQHWYFGVGAAINFTAGHVSRAPELMQRLGFEWVHRLYKEPRRLVRRYLWDDLPFCAVLFARSIRQRRGNR